MSGTVHYRRRVRVFPWPATHLNVSRSSSGRTNRSTWRVAGFSVSLSVRAFGVTYSLPSERTSVDLPGGFSYRTSAKGKGRSGGKATPPPAYLPSRKPWAAWFLACAVFVFVAIQLTGGVTPTAVAVWACLAALIGAVQTARARRIETARLRKMRAAAASANTTT